MADVSSHRPAPEIRSVVRINEFSRATGLGRQTADALVTGRKVEGLRHTDGRVFGFFDDALPTKEALRSLGLEIRDAYDPNVTVPTSAPTTTRVPPVARTGRAVNPQPGPCRGVMPIFLTVEWATPDV